MNREMKKKVKIEYIRMIGGNIITGMNLYGVGIIRNGPGALDWTKEELKSIDIKNRKLMTMNGCLQPRINVGRLYLRRKEGGKGFIN